MPVYEYRCDACTIQFELRQKFSDPPADKCPACGGPVRKMVSAASFSLKGGGWYGDGYGTKAEPAAPTGDAGAAAGTAPEAAAAGTTPATTTASPAAGAPVPAPAETKSTAAETPVAAKEKTAPKSKED